MTSKLYLSAAFGILAVFVFFGSGCSDGAGDYLAVLQGDEGSSLGQLENEVSVVERESFFENKETNTTLQIKTGVDAVSGKPILTSPFTLSGLTFVFENSFLWRVKDSNGDMVAGGMAQADSPDIGIPGPYKIKGFFDILPQTKDGLLEIYYGSFKDGSDVILLSVPVVFGQMQTKEVEVFFSNVKKDPDMLDCSKVYAVKRTAVVTDPIEAVAMHELLLGPTVAEKDAGYVTSLPDYVSQPDVYWTDDGLVMNFDDSLQAGVAGSCRVSAIRAQIENTMGKVCTETQACYLLVNGQQEEVLQP